ncbi:hypothetical protein PU629_12240 [Pullulanibacillus sp. KACC 23026]|uniref:hypothetical protein n=1 Tax=Pullulanibacillus sp. KACC 23026 TaxID=3028315 RepID=UPI0023B0B2E5|nr:hypothetical protein [Pullulanibacillus sp. KACC 23026]WEG10946.1 hypothetical protein PU629_12240 [Pullulanibacillus sp. KACC 23026]
MGPARALIWCIGASITQKGVPPRHDLVYGSPQRTGRIAITIVVAFEYAFYVFLISPINKEGNGLSFRE